MKKKYENYSSKIVLICACIALVLLVAPAMAAGGTTEITIIKYANDGITPLAQTTVDFEWMMANLPVYGDGSTVYYMEGPVGGWDINENNPAILTAPKYNFTAVKGTNVADLCNLVGGMKPTDKNVSLLAPDDFKVAFPYSVVYNPPARAGPVVLTWYSSDFGFVNQSYSKGMRNVQFADASTNPWGKHVFGLYDMHETFPESYWSYYTYPTDPSTTKLSNQNVNRIYIYSNDPVTPTPEFPSIALPVALIVGLLGAVLFVQKFKEN